MLWLRLFRSSLQRGVGGTVGLDAGEHRRAGVGDMVAVITLSLRAKATRDGGIGKCRRSGLLNCRQVDAGIEILGGGLRIRDTGVGHEEVADLLQPLHHRAI